MQPEIESQWNFQEVSQPFYAVVQNLCCIHTPKIADMQSWHVKVAVHFHLSKSTYFGITVQHTQADNLYEYKMYIHSGGEVKAIALHSEKKCRSY